MTVDMQIKFSFFLYALKKKEKQIKIILFIYFVILF